MRHRAIGAIGRAAFELLDALAEAIQWRHGTGTPPLTLSDVLADASLVNTASDFACILAPDRAS
jgi:hypothetical protein